MFDPEREGPLTYLSTAYPQVTHSLSTALALSLIAALALIATATSAWAVVLNLTRKPDVSSAELHQQVTALRLEVSEIVDKFTASQKRNAVRAMRERKDEEDAPQAEPAGDPAEVKRRLRQQVFGGFR